MADLSKTQKGGAAIAAAVLVAAPLAAQFEGYSAKVYKDPAGIPTYCYGETELARHDPSHIYAKSECMALLRARMARDYAPHLLQCVPAFVDIDRRFAFGALLDASYNAGWAAACKSRMADSFRAGDWAQGCAGFKGWYVTARNRTTGQRIMLKGLVRRRDAEAATCSSALPAPQQAPPPPQPVPPTPPPPPAAQAPQAKPQPTLWQRLAHLLGF